MEEILSKVVLVGASGTVGRPILHSLLESHTDNFAVTILSRPQSASTFAEDPRVKVVRIEYDSLEDLINVFKGHDAIIHAGGIPSLGTQKLMIEAAVLAGVPRFVLNEFAHSPVNQIGLPELEPFRVVKREMQSLAQQKAVENARFSWTGLATWNFIDYSLKKYPQFGFDIKNRTARLVDDGTEPFSAVVLDDIGRAVRGILRRPKATRNRFCHIRSVETCQNSILEALQEEMKGEGGEQWEVRYEDSGKMYERGKEAFARGERSGVMDLLVVQLFAKGGNRSILVGREESDNSLLGVEEKHVKEVVSEVLNSL